MLFTYNSSPWRQECSQLVVEVVGVGRMWVSTLSPCSFYPAFPLSRRRPSRSRRISDTRPTSCERACPCPAFPTVSLALPPHAADSSPVLGCFVFLPRPTGSIKTTKCCLSIRWYAHSWSTTLLWHSPGGTGLPTLSRLSFSLSLSFSLYSSARVLFRLFPFSSTAVVSFFVLLSEDLRIHGRSLRFLIIPA